MEKKELFFEDGQEDLSQDEWIRKGRPEIWFKVYDKKGITIFEDRAYGGIKLITSQGENQAKDLVKVKDVVAFGAYYTGILAIYTPYKAI